jgi:hypothetical protein
MRVRTERRAAHKMKKKRNRREQYAFIRTTRKKAAKPIIYGHFAAFVIIPSTVRAAAVTSYTTRFTRAPRSRCADEAAERIECGIRANSHVMKSEFLTARKATTLS